jgi:8-oxo-dGTP diphosphatase
MNSFGIENYLPQISIDCVIFGYQQKELKVLVAKLNFGEDLWSLPGGFIKKSESIDLAANRILKERTGLEDIYLEQFKTFGEAERVVGGEDNQKMIEALLTVFTPTEVEWLTNRFISIGYYALVDIKKFHPKALGEFEQEVAWRNISEAPQLIYDHNEILTSALAALQQDLDHKLIGFNLLPETFTMRELHDLYETISDRQILHNNFQKKMLTLNVLERLQKKYTGAANKAPYLYRFIK